MRIRTLLLAPVAALLAAAAPAAPDQLADSANRVRGHVEFLASDLLEGRESGTRGHDIAAAYVAAEFRKLGLEPAGKGGSWFQQVPFRKATHKQPPRVRYSVPGKAPVTLASGTDFGLRPSLTMAERSIDAPLLFVGHGIRAPRFGIDDFAGLDARGKILVALEGTPAGLPSDVAAHLESSKADIASAMGAIGLVEIARNGSEPGRMGALERRSRPLTGWTGPDDKSSAGTLAVDIGLSREWAERLFAGAPRSLAQARADSDRGTGKGFDLKGRLQIAATSEWETFTSPNVVARLPGRHPTRSAEHVALMGHLDHLGVDRNAKPGEDSIRNGALDNAGGVATMLEAARRFVQSGERPQRSILFVATTAEERGLLGASYFARYPSVSTDRIVGLVNLDMPLLLYDFSDVIAFGAEHSTMARMVADAASAMGVKVSPDPMPEQSLFVRSDHYPLVKAGVPSIFLMTGYANGGKDAWDRFFKSSYHRPSDDVAQQIHWLAAARFAELNYRIARTLADSEQRPLWYRDSFFGESFAPRQAKASGGPNGRPRS